MAKTTQIISGDGTDISFVVIGGKGDGKEIGLGKSIGPVVATFEVADDHPDANTHQIIE